MTTLTRRQILLGGSAIAAAGLIPGIPKTPLTPRMRLMSSAVAADISRPDYMVRLGANENPYGPSRVALKAISANMNLANRYADDPQSLMSVLAELNDLSMDNIVVGSGSSEILNVAGMISGLPALPIPSTPIITKKKSPNLLSPSPIDPSTSQVTWIYRFTRG